MGTVFSVDVRAPGCESSAIDDVVRWLHWVDSTFSTYRRDSQVSRLGRGEIGVSDCHPEVTAIVARCEELAAETGGYFSAHADGFLDPSGLVKGWAIQRADDMLQAAGSRNHCVNGGGDVRCAGSAGPDEPWRIGITDPIRPDQLAAVVAGTDLAVATSGSAERGSHIVNPLTGRRPDALASVTLVGRDLGTTDAYATAAFAMEFDAPGWIEDLDGYDGLIVFHDGTQWSSSGFIDPSRAPVTRSEGVGSASR